MSHIQRIFPLPRTHGDPCPRLLARAAALRDDAAEVAYQIGGLGAWQRDKLGSLMVQHQIHMLRAIAAQEMAHGREVLAREYVRAARRIERELAA